MQDPARFSDAEAVARHVERAQVVARRHQATHVGSVQADRRSGGFGIVEQQKLLGNVRLVLAEPVQQRERLIGEADADQRAARALRAVYKRRRDAHALFGLVVVNDRFVARVALLAQDERLHADLHAVCGHASSSPSRSRGAPCL